MAEVYKLKPLFAGSSELDQLYKICLVLGQPTQVSGLQRQFSSHWTEIYISTNATHLQ